MLEPNFMKPFDKSKCVRHIVKLSVPMYPGQWGPGPL